MKVILNAHSVKALLENDPEFFGELAKNASKQVADAFYRKAVGDKINATVDNKINDAFAKIDYARRVTLSEPLKAAIDGYASKAVEDAFKLFSGQLVQEFLIQAVRDALAAQFSDQLKKEVNDLVKDSLRKAIA